MSYWIIVVMMIFLVSSFLATRYTIGGVPTLFTKTMASIGFVLSAVLALIYTKFEKYYAFIANFLSGNPQKIPILSAFQA